MKYSKRLIIFGLLLLLGLGLLANIMPPNSFIPKVSGASPYLPVSGDAWTENDNATYPWVTQAGVPNIVAFTTEKAKVGTYSLRANITASTTLSIRVDTGATQDVSSYDFLSFYLWMTTVSPSQFYIQIQPTSWSSTNKINSAATTITVEQQTWSYVVIPLKNGFYNATGTTAWSNIRYIHFVTVGSSAGKLLYVDGLKFGTFNTPTITNPENDLWLPNTYQTIYANGEKRIVWNNKVYTSLNVAWNASIDATLESEILGQTLFNYALAYNASKDSFMLDRIHKIIDVLYILQNTTYAGGGIRKNYYNATGLFSDYMHSGHSGWGLLGLSTFYAIEANATVKTLADGIRQFLINKMWDATNNWFDSYVQISTSTITDATFWDAQISAPATAGLSAYYRFVSANATVLARINSSLNKAYSARYNRVGNTNFDVEGQSYIARAFYETYKVTSNATYYHTQLNAYYYKAMNHELVGNGSFTSNPAYGQKNSSTYLENGANVLFTLQLLQNYQDTNNPLMLALIQKTLRDYLYQVYTYQVSRYKNSGTTNDNVVFSDMQAYIFTILTKYYYQIYQPSNPYLISTTQEITATSYSSNQLSFTVSAPSGTTSTTKVYVGDKGNATEVWGATSWNYNATSKILSVTRLHTVAAVGISVFWYPTGIYGVEVVVGGIIAVGSGSLLFWWWRRKTKVWTVTAP